MSTKVIKDGNVTTTIMDLTNGVGGKSAEVRMKNLFNFFQGIFNGTFEMKNSIFIINDS